MTASSSAPVAPPMNPEERQALFPFLAEEEGALLAGFLEYRDYAAGALVMRDGAAADFFAFVARGKLAVQKETAFPGKHVLVAILEPGALVGDYGVASVSNGTVAALEASGLWIITRERMDSLLVEQPLLGQKILVRLIQVLALRLGKAYDRLAGLL